MRDIVAVDGTHLYDAGEQEAFASCSGQQVVLRRVPRPGFAKEEIAVGGIGYPPVPAQDEFINIRMLPAQLLESSAVFVLVAVANVTFNGSHTANHARGIGLNMHGVYPLCRVADVHFVFSGVGHSCCSNDLSQGGLHLSPAAYEPGLMKLEALGAAVTDAYSFK